MTLGRDVTSARGGAGPHVGPASRWSRAELSAAKLIPALGCCFPQSWVSWFLVNLGVRPFLSLQPLALLLLLVAALRLCRFPGKLLKRDLFCHAFIQLFYLEHQAKHCAKRSDIKRN